MTQVDASKASGIPQSTISTSERESNGSSDTPVYAKLYGVDAHWLATGEGEMIPAGRSELAQVGSTTEDLPMDVLLTKLQAIVEGLAPVLQEPGRAALLKWMQGQASAKMTAATLHAYQQASKALPTSMPAALVETPGRRPSVDHD